LCCRGHRGSIGASRREFGALLLLLRSVELTFRSTCRSSTAFTSTNTSGTYSTTPTNFDFSAELALDCEFSSFPSCSLADSASPLSRRPRLLHPHQALRSGGYSLRPRHERTDRDGQAGRQHSAARPVDHDPHDASALSNELYVAHLHPRPTPLTSPPFRQSPTRATRPTRT